MKKRYKEIMEKVEVTNEMRNRILDQIQNTDFALLTAEPLQLEQKKHFQYKKHMWAAACLAILLIGAATTPGIIGRMGTSGPAGPVTPNGPVSPTGPADPGSLTGSNGPNESPVQMVPDIQEYASLDELSTAISFPVMELNNLPFGVEETVYLAFWQKLAQIKYSGDGMTVTFRMSAGTEDTSGDYNSYDTVTEYRIGKPIAGDDTTEETIVTLKGSGGGYSLALWTDGKFFYSIKMSDEQSAEVFLNIISGMSAG